MKARRLAPPDLRILILCARVRLERTHTEQLASIIASGPDWDRVLTQAQRHGLMPLLHRHVTGLGRAVPAAVRAKLNTYARQNAVHTLGLTHALLGVLSALAEEGMSAVPYKGPSLAKSAYGDIALRSFKDLDIIVQPQDIDRAGGVLRALGYVPTDTYAETHFHQGFVHAQTGVRLELHRDVIQRRYFPTSLELGTMWAELTYGQLLGRRVASFTPEDTLLLLCLHGSKHEWQGLIWVADVAEFIRAHPNLAWERVLEKAAQANIERMVLLGLYLAAELLDAPVSPEWQSALGADPALPRLAERIVARMYEDRGVLDRATLSYRLHLAMRSDVRARWPIVRRLAAFFVRPNPQDRAAASLPSGLGAVYYVIRPLRLMRRYLRPGKHPDSV